jgi:tol-pal system protein YbgF
MLRRSLGSIAAAGLALGLLVLPARAQDEGADFVVRLNRLESQIRTLTGQVEQAQYENRQLRDQLRKFQEDVDFRLKEGGGRSGAASPPPAARPGKRSDAFDPSESPTAPGAPRTLGAAGPTPEPRAVPRAALDEGAAAAPSGQPIDLSAAARAGLPSGNGRAAPSVAAGGPDARSDYDTAYAAYQGRRYEQAEMGFRQFIQSHPRDRQVSDATYWLGESYLQRNRNREAAEQFLKVSTDYARSTRAPDAMLKLGVALNALGAKDQACATFAELGRKFPQASANVRQGVDREQKRARCA